MMSNEFSKASWNAYYAWSYRHLDLIDREAEVSKTCFNAGFYLGAQYATRVTGEMSPHLARFMEFVMWLTERPEDSTSSSTNRGTSSAWYCERCQCDLRDNFDTHQREKHEDEELDDPNGYAVLQAHHLQGHRTELRNDDSVFCLECQSTVAVADG